MSEAPRLTLQEVAILERDVVLRMPFRFGVVTLTAAPQAFLRARIRLADGREGWGTAADVLAPKWFDKSPGLSNEDNFQQLRRAMILAAGAYRSQPSAHSAFGLHQAAAAEHGRVCAAEGLPPLVASFGTALLDRAILDALLRLVGLSLYAGVRANVMGMADATADLAGFDMARFLASLTPAQTIKARHTVGLVDPITRADQADQDRLEDGLPETLEEVVQAYGVDHFKLKVGGDVEADLDRLSQIAGVIDRLPAYRATLDGNEQYGDVDGVIALWHAMEATPALSRLRDSILFIEQPIARSVALGADIAGLARLKPVEIDESDGTDDAFLQAKALGYTGVSSKSCKGLYRSLINRARCAQWNQREGVERFFMSAEDLTTQAGIGVQQDLALATLIGCDHVERNGHHYVNGMAALPQAEQAAFLAAHGDLYHRAHGAVRLKIEGGSLAIGSLDGPGLAHGALPEFATMASVHHEA